MLSQWHDFTQFGKVRQSSMLVFPMFARAYPWCLYVRNNVFCNSTWWPVCKTTTAERAAITYFAVKCLSVRAGQPFERGIQGTKVEDKNSSAVALQKNPATDVRHINALAYLQTIDTTECAVLCL